MRIVPIKRLPSGVKSPETRMNKGSCQDRAKVDTPSTLGAVDNSSQVPTTFRNIYIIIIIIHIVTDDSKLENLPSTA